MSLANIETYDEATSVGREIVSTHSDSAFMLGDLANHVQVLRANDPEVKKKEKTLKIFARDIGIGYGRLKEVSRVARAIEPGVRASFAMLTFSHWRAMVRRGIEGPALIEWATKAHDGEWSADRLDAELGGLAPVRGDVEKLARWIARTGVSARKFEVDNELIERAVAGNREQASIDVGSIRGLVEQVEDVLL